MELLADPRTLSDRLVEVAPLSDKISSIGQADDGTWVLEFSDKTLVLMEWASKPDRIVLNSPLGVPTKERAEELFALALSFSALSRDSCGARLGLGGEDGELLLIRELYSETAGGWDLLPVLEHFAYVSGWWQSIISQPSRASQSHEDLSGLLLRA
jgi:hypothetical protein